jgi:hypothetical protein
MPIRFPSLAFFQALQQRTKDAHDVFEKMGTCDTRFGVRIGDQLYAITFDVYDCTDVREGGNPAELDFVLAAPPPVWNAMIESIRKHGGAGIDHTLNTLTHLGDVVKVEYEDAEGHDKLYRFMATIQEFFDQARHLDVVVG